MAWIICETCRGKMRVPDRNNPGQTKVCPACRGEGGANTTTTP